MLDGPDGISGHRHVCHSLQLKGHQVPRRVVVNLLPELDPDGYQQRKGHIFFPYVVIKNSCHLDSAFAVPVPWQCKVLPYQIWATVILPPLKFC